MEAIAIDWSGAVNPGKAICLARAEDGELLDLTVGLSRERAIERAIEAAAIRPDTVIGLDFAFSMPAWFLRSRGLSSARELWLLAATEGETWLATCEAPFWGRPGRRRPVIADHFRNAERLTAPVTGIRPKSVFQIGGAGAVGTGSIRGMPFLLRLAEAGVNVWPFDEPRSPYAVEIWPRLLTGPVVKSSPVGRRSYLEALGSTVIRPDLAQRAADSEDAFDAAVSAVVMSRHAGHFAVLERATDPVTLLEGRIWAPQLVSR